MVEKVKIGDVLLVTDFVANGSFASLRENVEYNYEKDYSILVRITDGTKNWKGNFVYVSKKSFDYLKKSSVLPGDLIIANVGEPGKAFIIPDLGMPMTLGPNSILVRPLNNQLHTKFFYYYTISKYGQAQIEAISSATTQKKFNKTSYRNLEFPLPPLETQIKIANALDKADSIRQKDKQIIQKYDELLQSVFLEMFGDPILNTKNWATTTLGSVSSKITDGTHKTPTYLSSGVKFISAKNIKNGKLQWTDIKFISPEEHNEIYKRCNTKFGDILITKSGSIGMAAIVEESFEFSLFESLALVKTYPQKINNVFLRELINSKAFNTFLLRQIKGVGVKHLHLVDIRNLRIILPELPLQDQFGKMVSKIVFQRSLAERSLQKSEELFNSILQRAFKGELFPEPVYA